MDAINGEILVKTESQGFKLSIEKSEFGIPEITFLGHTIKGNGIKPKKISQKKF